MRLEISVKYWGLIGLVVFTTIWFLPWRFDTNDDVLMMWLVSGAYTGEPESYGIFTHPILTWVLSNLYGLSPTVRWYPITWFLVIYLSFLGVALCVSQTSLVDTLKRLLIFFVLILWIHFALFLQFTIVAGIAGFSGLLLFEKYTQNNTMLFKSFGLFLIIMSILIRWEAFVLLGLGFGFYQLAFNRMYFLKYIDGKYLSVLIVFTGLFLSDYFYVTNSKYAELKAYTKARAAVFDHPAFRFTGNTDALKLDKKWFYFSQSMMDGNSIDVKELKAMKAQLDAKLFTFAAFKDSFSRLKEGLVFQNFKKAFSIMFLLIYIITFWAMPRKLFFCVGWLVFMFGFNHFFIVNPRVYILFFLPLLFPIISNREAYLPKSIVPTFCVLVSSILVVHLFNFSAEAERRKLLSIEFEVGLKQVKKDKLVIYEGNQQQFFPTNFTKNNIVPYLSMGWISNSPFQKKKLQNFDLKSIKDVEEFYLMGSDEKEELYFPYYMQYLGGKYKLENIEKGSNLSFIYYSLIL